MKLHLSLFTLILLLTTSISKADDYVWGEEFKEGDVISAATFNQIFGTLQKLNRTPIDADLVGTWSCDSVNSFSGGLDNTGWVVNEFLLTLTNAQLTMTASSQSTSLAAAYSFSTSNPSPFIRLGTNTAASGTYKLFKNMLLMKGIMSVSAVSKYQLDVVSNDRFILTPLSDGGNYPDLIICDSAVAVPAAPTTTTATNAQTTVNVTWTDQSSDETGFKIYRRLSTETEATQLATAVTASPYVDSTLTEGQTAYYSVSSYNANGESAKSKTVSATLDSILPTVASHSPTANQQIAKTSNTVSIYFSESIKRICPADESDFSCGKNEYSPLGYAVNVVGAGGPYICVGFRNFLNDPTSVLSSECENPSNSFHPNDTITVTIRKGWIVDVNGNHMDADYTYTFTTGT